MRTRAQFLNDIKDLVAHEVDWNLRDAKIVGYRVTPDCRLQVALIDQCPRGAEDTREYLTGLTEVFDLKRIDIIVRHEKP